jgi:RHS repeat-associated protein
VKNYFVRLFVLLVVVLCALLPAFAVKPCKDSSYCPDPTDTDYNSIEAARSSFQNQRGITPGTQALQPSGSSIPGNPGSQSYNYAIPIVHLPGRNGLDLNLTLYYNSRLWTVYPARNGMWGASFNTDRDAAGYGFRLDFGYIEGLYDDSFFGSYVLTEADGSKHRLVGNGHGYDSQDSTYIHYDDVDATHTYHTLVYKNGRKVHYTQPDPSMALYYPDQITDTNGNFITITYDSNSHVSQIHDTLGRTITFNYDPNGKIVNVAQGSKVYAMFTWGSIPLNYNFDPAKFPQAPYGIRAPVNGWSINVLTSCTYANGTAYAFSYGDWGIVNKITKLAATSPITIPSTSRVVRGYVAYNFPSAATPLEDAPSYTQETIFDGVNTTTSNFSVTKDANGNITSSSVTDPSGTTTTTTVQTDTGDPSKILLVGAPLSVVVQSGNTLLRQTDYAWVEDANNNNAQISSVTTTLGDSGQKSQVQYTYDINGNITQQNDLGWGLKLKRYTKNSYATLSNHIVDRVSQVLVYDASNNLITRTDFGYDGTTLSLVSGATNHDDVNFSDSFTTRGNRTSSTRYTNAAGGSGAITKNFYYDTLGNLIQADADCCTQEQWTYTANTQYSYPETTVRGPSGLQLSVSGTYDVATGNTLSTTDENGQTTYFVYNDPMDRLTQVNSPEPTAPKGRVYANTGYDDTSALVGTTNSSTANSAVQTSTSDDKGRVLWQQTLNGSTLVSTVDTTYDDVNRTVKTSNPYGPSDSLVWNTTQMDNLGRIVSRTPPSGGSYTYSYNGNSSTTTDPANQQIRKYHDAFGQLVQVDEPGGGSSASAASGSLTINGTLRSFATGKQSATSGRVELTLSGTLQSKASCSPSGQPCTDSGSISITVAGSTKSVSYSSSTGTDSGQSVHALANAFHLDTTSPVDAIFYGADESGNIVVDLIARAKGAATNYPLSTSIVSNDPTDFPSPSFQVSSGSHLIGGQDASNGGTIYDSGIVYVAMRGFTASASYGQNGNNTAALIASALVGTGPTGLNQPGSPVTASASGSTITMTYKTPGASGNIFVNLPSSSYQPDNPSFTTPGVMLSGGSDLTPDSLNAPISTLYAYDALGNLTQVTQGVQTRTTMYDNLGRVTSITTPEGGTTQLFYITSSGAVCSSDPDSPCRRVDSRGYTTTYAYDGLDRVKAVNYPDSSTTARVFSYDVGGAAANALGRLTSAGDAGTSPGHYETYSYDVVGRLSQVSATGANDLQSMVSYQYNPAGQVTQITYPSTRVVTNNYDAGGRLSSVQSNGSTYFTSNSYSAAGQLLSFTYGNTVQGSLAYNDHQQLNSIQYSQPGAAAGNLLNLSYSYTGPNSQNNGEVQGITDARGPAYSTNYIYDSLSRLVAAQTNDLTAPNTWALNWPYDRYGNRLSENVVGGTLALGTPQLSIDPATNRINTPGFMYDASGNMISDGTPGRSRTYDAENRLLSQTDGGATSASYGYDVADLRIRKDLWSASGGTLTKTSSTTYVYAGDQVIAEYLNGSLSKEYIYAGSQRLATLDAPGNAIYHHPDHLSNRLETDASGNVVHTFGHLPFGETWYETGALDKWKFTTYERDSESGLDYAAARYYSSGLGRFMSLDPLAGNSSNPQSLNRYSYVTNDPITYLDPSGAGECDGITMCHEIDGGGGDGGGGGDIGGGDGPPSDMPPPDAPGSPSPAPPDEPIILPTTPLTELVINDSGDLGIVTIPTTVQTVNGTTGEVTTENYGFGPDSPAVPPAHETSFLDCVRAGTNYFSLQNGLKSLTGGRLGNGVISKALLGNSVQNGVDIGEAIAKGDAGEVGKEVGAETLVHLGPPVAHSLAPYVPNITKTVAVGWSYRYFTGGWEAKQILSTTIRYPLKSMATKATGLIAKPLEEIELRVKLPVDITIFSFSSIVCGIGR